MRLAHCPKPKRALLALEQQSDIPKLRNAGERFNFSRANTRLLRCLGFNFGICSKQTFSAPF
jgi:hypothetical protein